MSGCVLEIPQYKVHVVEIWEKGQKVVYIKDE